MTILAIDTVSTICAVGIFDSETGLMRASRSGDIGRGHAEHLLDQIEAVLVEAGMALTDIGSIAVNVGPGSFTGIRVGVAAARGLALALDRPVYGVSAMDAAAADIAGRDGFALAIPAGRGSVFFATYSGDGIAKTPPARLAIDKAASQLEVDTASVAGPAGNDIITASGRTDLRPGPAIATGCIETIARLSQTVPREPAPLYLRDADARVQSGFALPHAGENAS